MERERFFHSSPVLENFGQKKTSIKGNFQGKDFDIFKKGNFWKKNLPPLKTNVVEQKNMAKFFYALERGEHSETAERGAERTPLKTGAEKTLAH